MKNIVVNVRYRYIGHICEFTDDNASNADVKIAVLRQTDRQIELWGDDQEQHAERYELQVKVTLIRIRYLYTKDKKWRYCHS